MHTATYWDNQAHKLASVGNSNGLTVRLHLCCRCLKLGGTLVKVIDNPPVYAHQKCWDQYQIHRRH